MTTDASQFAIGAVLSQDNHPICFGSRTLNEHEIQYSTIEKELLAIVWATKYYRPYLFGQKFTIRTDHQPLKWLSSLKEPNSKLQRWRIRLNEYDYDIEFIKGKDNTVADFLSRIDTNTNEINTVEEGSQESDRATIHSSAEQLNDHIPIIETVVNKYLTQIHLVEKKDEEIKIKNKRYRQIFISLKDFKNEGYVNDLLRRLIKKGVTGTYSELDDTNYNILQQKLIELFSQDKNVRFIKCTVRAQDLENEEEVIKIIEKIHKETNHRGINENFEELKNTYFYPKLKELIHKFNNNCETCNLAKYDRHPIKVKFSISETPNSPNEIIHADLFFSHKQFFLTTFDKFTKHLFAVKLNDRNSISIIQALKYRFSIFSKPKKLVVDNEFNSLNMKEFCRVEEIEVHFTSPRSHTGNSDIERAHGTLNEHLRIFETEKIKLSLEEKVLKALEYYNNTIHSTTQAKPSDFINNKIMDLKKIKDRIHSKKVGNILKVNKDRQDFGIRNKTEETVVQNPNVERHKVELRYIKIKTKNVDNKLRDNKNKNIHPCRIKRNFKYFSGVDNIVANNNNIDTSKGSN